MLIKKGLATRLGWGWKFCHGATCISKAGRLANARSWLNSTCGQNYTALIDGWLAPISCTGNYCKWSAPSPGFSREPLALSWNQQSWTSNRFRLMNNALKRSRKEVTRYPCSRTLPTSGKSPKVFSLVVSFGTFCICMQKFCILLYLLEHFILLSFFLSGSPNVMWIARYKIYNSLLRQLHISAA